MSEGRSESACGWNPSPARSDDVTCTRCHHESWPMADCTAPEPRERLNGSSCAPLSQGAAPRAGATGSPRGATSGAQRPRRATVAPGCRVREGQRGDRGGGCCPRADELSSAPRRNQRSTEPARACWERATLRSPDKGRPELRPARRAPARRGFTPRGRQRRSGRTDRQTGRIARRGTVSSSCLPARVSSAAPALGSQRSCIFP